MSGFYEDTLLKEEFNLVARLQQDEESSRYVSVAYEDRSYGEDRPVSIAPSGSRYPEKYIVQYRMPVYVSPGQLRRDWQGTATMQLSEPVLTNKHSYHGPHVTFHSNFEPFNNHVLMNSICSGNAWAVARDNGLWHFIISLGALINQDEFVCAEGGHYNRDAYDYWLSRDRKPVTNIKWPLDLLSKEDARILFTPKAPQSDALKIVAKTPEPQKPKINITKTPEVNKTPQPITIEIKPKPTLPATRTSPLITITEKKR